MDDRVAVSGRRIVVHTGTNNRAKFLSKDAAINLLHDPRSEPTVVVVQGAGAVPGSTGVITLDPAKWIARGGAALKDYRYKDTKGTHGGITKIRLARGRLEIKAKGDNWGWQPAGSQDSVSVQFRIWKTEYCADFGGAISKNEAGLFKATHAAAPSGCPSLAPVDDGEFSAVMFSNPPREFRPQIRWWWPGAAVDDDTIRDNLRTLADTGFGAIEIQPLVLGITNADIAADPRVRTVGDAAYLDRINTAGCEAKALGLQWDVTLGSGWSSGGPSIDAEGERQLLLASTTLVGPSVFNGSLPEPVEPTWVATINSFLPALDGFDEAFSLVGVVAMEVLDDAVSPPLLGPGTDLTSMVSGDTLVWNVPAGTHQLFAFYENKTLHFPAGGAFLGAREDSRIADHLDRSGVDTIIAEQGSPWLAALAACPPRAIFVDSFELIGELPWTTTFSSDFAASFGYDIELFLPFIFRFGGESEYTRILGSGELPLYQTADSLGVRAREDYEHYRGTVFQEEFIEPLHDWTQANDVALRLQAHGGYADILDAYASSDVPESEGLYAGGAYDFLKLASSAAHVAGHRHTSSETFVSVSPGGADLLTLDQFRLLAGRAYSAGINRIMYHGTPYPFDHTDGSRWFPFDPIADNSFPLSPFTITYDLHPGAAVWSSVPDLNAQMTRLSYALSRGTHTADVAWLMPEREWMNFVNFNSTTVMPRAHESDLSQAIRGAGYVYDRISAGSLMDSSAAGGQLHVGAATYRALVVDNVAVAEPELLAAIEAAVAGGVPVVWLGGFPSRAPGLVDRATRDASVLISVSALMASVDVAATETDVPVAISDAGVLPSIGPAGPGELSVSIERRSVNDGDLYFIFNESYAPLSSTMQLNAPFVEAWLLDPETGEITASGIADNLLPLSLPAAGGSILWLKQ